MSEARKIKESYEIFQLASQEDVVRILNCFSGFFIILSHELEVIDCNQEFLDFFGFKKESILGKYFGNVFDSSIQKFLNPFLVQVSEKHSSSSISSGLGKQNSLEIEFNRMENGAKDLLKEQDSVFVSFEFKDTQIKGDRLYFVFGREISELKKKEKKLNDIFLSIPLGILTLKKNGIIENGYSSYCEYLFGTNQLGGKSIKDVFFNYALEDLKEKEKQGIDLLIDCIGKPSFSFESSKTDFPQKLHFVPLRGLKRYFSVIYEPIIVSSKVEKILLIVEDQTEFITVREEEEKARKVEELTIARFLQIKNCSSSVLSIIIEEIQSLMTKMEESLLQMEIQEVFNCVHGIKGNARIGGFTFLATLVHEFETRNSSHRNELTRERLREHLNEELEKIRAEWNELLMLYKAVHSGEKGLGNLSANSALAGHSAQSLIVDSNISAGSIVDFKSLIIKYQKYISIKSYDASIYAERVNLALQSFNLFSLKSLEESCKARVQQTALKLDKNVKLEFEWSDLWIDTSLKTVISDSLLHILNNALAHGLERGDERVSLGKSPTGRISIRVSESSKNLKIEIEDDGKGIDVEKIKSIALRNKVISLEDALEFDKEKILQLIFLPGFTTKDEADELSGRGVGLSAVYSSLKSIKGRIEVTTRPSLGTQFNVYVPISKNFYFQKSCIPLRSFFEKIEQQIFELSLSMGFTSTTIEGVHLESLRKGLLYVDPFFLSLTLTTFIGHFSQKNPVQIQFVRGEAGSIECRVHRKRVNPESKIELEFELALWACNEYLKENGGSFYIDDDFMLIHFGLLLVKEKMPILYLGMDSEISYPEAKETIDIVLDVAQVLDVPLMFVMPGEKLDKPLDLLICSNQMNPQDQQNESFDPNTVKMANEEKSFTIHLFSQRQEIEKKLLNLISKSLGV